MRQTSRGYLFAARRAYPRGPSCVHSAFLAQRVLPWSAPRSWSRCRQDAAWRSHRRSARSSHRPATTQIPPTIARSRYRAARSRRRSGSRMPAARCSSGTRRAMRVVAIGQSVSIVAPPGVYAGISVPSGAGVSVSGSGLRVVLRGLTINGQGGSVGVSVFGSNRRGAPRGPGDLRLCRRGDPSGRNGDPRIRHRRGTALQLERRHPDFGRSAGLRGPGAHGGERTGGCIGLQRRRALRPRQRRPPQQHRF